MDFFAGQDVARRKTSLLLVYFGLAVILIILAIYLAISLVFVSQQGDNGQFGLIRLWNPELFVTVACATVIVVMGGSIYKISALRSGGVRVAEMLGGRLIPSGTDDFLEKRLLNIVEEIAIASGVAVLPVYLMEEEKGINAFAAGFTPEDAVIGITRGALETLNREELQGVVAHEFSHILNGDMRLDLKLVGLLHGILLIAFIGRSILRGSSRSRDSKNSGGAVIFGLILLILGYIGVLFGKLIKSGVSRQREYLADASAVQFTRNASGLAGALKKIGGLASGSLIGHNKAEEISHMFFSNGVKAGWLEAFSTHPPLVARIIRLDPGFDGVFPQVVQGQRDTVEAGGAEAEGKKYPGNIPPWAAAEGLAFLAAHPEKITRDIGAPVREHMESARRLLASLPQHLRDAASDPFGARAVIYALLLDRDGEGRARQMEHLKVAADKAVFEAVEKISPVLLSLDEEARLPLMDLTMPSLRSMSLEQFRRFAENIEHLVRIDEKISLFEFVLEHVIVRRLERSFIKPQPPVKNIDSVRDAAAEISAILSLLANIGHKDDEAALAFAAAAETFNQHRPALSYLTRKQCQEIKLDAVLSRLTQLTPKIMQLLVTACFKSLVHDRQITMKEAEFFRLLAHGLDIPLSPWVTG